MVQAEWVAVDWGTSNVRAWGMAPDGAVVFSAQSDRGMGKIASPDYPAVLDELIAGRTRPNTDIVICGMAGARQGWREAPYIETPALLSEIGMGSVRPSEGVAGGVPRILPGVCQRGTGREDVMRGEETQLLGLLALHPGFSGVAILPGTHSKWAEVKDGRLLRFVTAMTGEFFELLSTRSVLRHAFGAAEDDIEIDVGFAEGVGVGLDRGAAVTALLFRIRAASLLSGRSAGWCEGYLSGLLIGAEIGGLRDWLGETAVPLIGSLRLGRRYAEALQVLGVASFVVDAAEATRAGLGAARAAL